ncbi:MAG TPA: N-acetylglucosamine-6-phosphate deacetylase [Bacillota bacterium]|nr:N-acetylglucosamine-6-phosphate deacetylase [Bacillota bacterium]
MNQLALTKATMISPFNLVEDAVVLIKDKKVLAAGSPSSVKIPPEFQEISLDGLLLAPGFIDQHVHGGGGASVMSGTAESLDEISRFYATHGTTSFLATTISGTTEQIDNVACAYKTLISRDYKGARCLGLHLEGPFISPYFAGSHPPETLRQPSWEEIASIHKLSNSGVKLVTLAPEIAGASELAAALAKANITCAIGHSNADYETTINAISLGFRSVTHCYNQLTPFNHYAPGVIGAAFTNDHLSIELVLDEVHLHHSAVEIAWRCKGPEGIILVTNAMAPTGMPDGLYATPDGDLTLAGGAVRNQSGKLAGSVLTMERAVKKMLDITECSLTDAFRMATYNPAKLLGLNKHKGSIYPGKDADLIALTTDLEVIMTMIGGEVISGLISI